jgi:CRP-like cAMP-binding protein
VPGSHAALGRFLTRLETHSTLTSAEREAILGLSWREVRFRANRDLARPGETVAHATLVAEGWVGRFESMRSGAREITALYLPGDLADLHSTVLPTISWGLTALGDATVLHISHHQLADLASRYPDLALTFWRDTALDSSILAKWIANIGRKDARARIAHLLCEVGLRCERAGLGQRDQYSFPLKQEQLGDATALTAVHVNRMIGALTREGLIAIKNKHVVIRWDELVSLAEFLPAYLGSGTAESRGAASDAKPVQRTQSSS